MIFANVLSVMAKGAGEVGLLATKIYKLGVLFLIILDPFHIL